MKSYAYKLFGYDIPNAKALKDWLIIENFNFFTEISPVFEIWIISKRKKNAEHLAMEVTREADEIIT